MKSINTGSQVCGLLWSIQRPELVSTHGFTKNDIRIWQYPTLQQVATLETGHSSSKVVHMASSPDSENIAVAAADQIINFWKVFEKQIKTTNKSELSLFGKIR